MAVTTRFSLLAVMLTYVTVTVGESILAPLLPMASPHLGITPVEGSRILAVLVVGTAIGNLVGGVLLGRLGAKVSSMVGVGMTTVGALIATIPASVGVFIMAHAFVGLGAGVFFAGGIYSVGKLADPARRGSAMGQYGNAFSVALALAAGLVALIGPDVWRRVFAVAAALGVVSMVGLWFAALPPRQELLGSDAGGLRLLVLPVAVGGIAAVAQFGLVVFIPTVVVDVWAMSASAGALVLLVGRVLSIPGKAIAGRLVDRFGALPTARMIGMVLCGSGALWLLLPWVPAAAASATVFAAGAGAMFPVANVVAVDRFGGRGGLLGIFRSLQMVVAAVSVWLVGLGAATLGLKTALLIGVFGLLMILVIRRSV